MVSAPRPSVAVIAHRGGAGLWPENTAEAFANAFALGTDGAELDVHLSRDGTLVVFHDETLKPEIVRDGAGAWLTARGPRLSALTYDDLAGFDVGRLKPGTAYAARHPEQRAIDGARIPRLEDVIALAKAAKGAPRLWIELKTPLLGAEGLEAPAPLTEAVIACLRRTDFIDRATLIAFDWQCLVHARRLEPAIETRATTLPQRWFGPDPVPPEHGPPPAPALAELRRHAEAGAPWEAGCHPRDHGGLIGAVAALGVDGWFPFHPDLTNVTAAEAKARGLSLAAWTVDAPEEMRRLLPLGLDAICTDRPDRLLTLLDEARHGRA